MKHSHSLWFLLGVFLGFGIFRLMYSKFKNQPSTCAKGHSHRSKLEAAVCQMIQLREAAGEIELLQVEDHVYLTDARILYIPDFRCLDKKTGRELWIEAKGRHADHRWPTIKKLWKHYGPGPLEIWMGDYRNLKLTDTIVPVKYSKLLPPPDSL